MASEQPSAARARLVVLGVWTLPSLILCLLCGFTYHHYRHSPGQGMSESERAAFASCLRSRLLLREPAAIEDSREGRRRSIAVSVYQGGFLRGQVSVRGESLSALCDEAAKLLASERGVKQLATSRRRAAHLQIDELISRAPLLEGPSLLAGLGLHPELDGFGVRIHGAEHLMLPTEIVDKGLLVSNRPLPYVPDFRFGFDRKRAETILRQRSGLSEEEWQGSKRELFRFRVASFVQLPGEEGQLRAMERGRFQAPELTPESLEEGALAGGAYLVRHLGDNGRYIYLSNLATGKQSSPKKGGAYSLPRHAGTTYFLAELYRHTQAEFLVEPIERAIGHFGDLIEASQCGGRTAEGRDFRCVIDKGQKAAELGGTALAVVALAEYQRATGSTRFESMLRGMAEFLLHMQRADGSFAHRYILAEARIDHEAELLYYSGEAALGLARAYRVTGDERYLHASERALDWLVSWYDFFLGSFFYGEEHWTCIAAEALLPEVKKERYWDFCRGYGAFLRQHQTVPGDFQDQEDWVGSYYFTPFLAPQNTPAGSRSEAMISTYRLGLAHGERDKELWEQVRAAMSYSLRQQVRSLDLYRIPATIGALGAIPGGPTDRSVRIDYVQHVCSAMIRAAELMREGETP